MQDSLPGGHGHGHGLDAGPGADAALTGPGGSRRRVVTALAAILVPVTLLLVAAMIALWPSGSHRELSLADPYGTASGVTLFSGTVTAVEPRDCGPQAGALETPGGAVVGEGAAAQVRCVDAIVDPDGGGTDAARVPVPPEVGASRDVSVGDRIKALDLSALPGGTADADAGGPAAGAGASGAVDHVFVDFERAVPVVALAALYALVVVLVARWRGVRAILGLGLAFTVLFWFMVPALLEGGPPLWVGLVGCSLIMVVVLYFAHGFSLRTTTALLGTLIGLGLTAVLAAWGTDAAALTGMGDEYSYVLAAVAPEVRLSGIVLCGLLVAGLGVLNDVTITQSSAVWELQAANPRACARELFAAGMRIGRDHIASTVYTIAFAYAGAALPLLIVVSLYDRSLADTLLSAELVEEVVRILVGSIGLVLAIPVTTAIAVGVAKAVQVQVQVPAPAQVRAGSDRPGRGQRADAGR
ncbi:MULTISPECIES: YibE/F family protein [Citricoccus]|uniref:YibE/F family protein n=1 Tax=Citricoccus TaxID=169133 RepID=UPI000255EBD8|nr:YibE/F family protein [Citricoccus sp. CH26A]